jgi:predicted transcriptional regulator
VTSSDRDTLIERMGLAAETDGFSRIAGRLFGALLLSEQPRSLDDLAEELAVSKASVSTEARRLLERGVAERVGKIGDRRDYYTLAPDFFVQIIRSRLGRWAGFHRLTHEMHSAVSDQPRVVRDRLAYVENVDAFVLARIDDALLEWAEHQGRGGPVPRSPRRGAPKNSRKRPSQGDRLG